MQRILADFLSFFFKKILILVLAGAVFYLVWPQVADMVFSLKTTTALTDTTETSYY